MRDHIVDVQLARLSARAQDDPRLQEEVAGYRKSLLATFGPEYVESCKARRDETYVACALASTSKKELDACD